MSARHASLDADRGERHDRAALPPASPARAGALPRAARLLRRLGPAGPMALVATALPPLGAVALLGAAAALAPRLRETPGAPLVCVAAFAVLGGFSLLPTYALSILAGWTFGFALGFPTALAGMVAAALVGHAVARQVSGERLLRIIDEKPAWRAVHFALLGSGFWRAVWIILLLRVAPIPPFALTNLVLGAAHVRLSRFLTGTAVGMLPQACVLSLAAAGLHQVSFDPGAAAGGGQRWLIVAGVAALVAAVIVISRAARRALASVATFDGEEGQGNVGAADAQRVPGEASPPPTE